jgi:hypothetical protein
VIPEQADFPFNRKHSAFRACARLRPSRSSEVAIPVPVATQPEGATKIKIPTKTVFKFRVANAANDAILGAKK